MKIRDQIAIIPFVLYMLFWWLVKLNELPGLHGDEAWVGIMAIKIGKEGFTYLKPMNNYTGTLQTFFSWLSFEIFGSGVAQLRYVGILFNFINIIAVTYLLSVFNIKNLQFFFLLIVSQSTFFLVSPRIAWEVNSFTFCLISLQLIAIYRLQIDTGKAYQFWLVLFFAINILGTYNHIIFSCASISGWVGLLLWKMNQKSNRYDSYIFIGFSNLINLITIFLLMRYSIISNYILSSVILLILIIYIEVVILSKANHYQLPSGTKHNIRKPLLFLMIIGVSIFVYFHGFTLFQIIANYKILTHVFSYEPHPLVLYIFIALATLYLVLFLKYVIKDFFNVEGSILPYVIITYMCMINLYTLETSFRYYLTLFFLISLYMSYKFSLSYKYRWLITFLLFTNFSLVNYSMINIFWFREKMIKPVHFSLGIGKTETSAHFLPTSPVVNYLRANKTMNFSTLGESFFIEKPIFFYYLTQPWEVSSKKTINISYDYTKYGTGFSITGVKKQ